MADHFIIIETLHNMSATTDVGLIYQGREVGGDLVSCHGIKQNPSMRRMGWKFSLEEGRHDEPDVHSQLHFLEQTTGFPRGGLEQRFPKGLLHLLRIRTFGQLSAMIVSGQLGNAAYIHTKWHPIGFLPIQDAAYIGVVIDHNIHHIDVPMRETQWQFAQLIHSSEETFYQLFVWRDPRIVPFQIHWQ
jgi:hypothetical protein